MLRNFVVGRKNSGINCRQNPNRIKISYLLSNYTHLLAEMPRTKASIRLREQWLHQHYLEHLLLDRRYPYRLRQPSPLALAAAYNRKMAASGSSDRVTGKYY